MVKQWIRHAFWRPFAAMCRRTPLVPLKATITSPVEGVTCIRIDNGVTRLLSRFSGGYDYAVCYLVDNTLMIDTGFGWARRSLRKTLIDLGADRTLSTVVNTHYHEDHTGNNDLLLEITPARLYAHPLAVPEIRFPPTLAWYRSFLFGPSRTVEIEPVGESVETARYRFDVYHMPGHCPGHICLFEPNERWLFSGDLYIAADLDSQLADADGPAWIASLEQAIELRPEFLFDAHGVIVAGAEPIRELLERKRSFLVEIRRRVLEAADTPQTIDELTRRVFDRHGLVDYLSFSDGWMSLITGSDFSRGNLIKSFLREQHPADLLHHSL